MHRGQGKSPSSIPSVSIPSVWLMTDDRIAQADLLRAISRLPRGSAVVVRHYSLALDERRGLFNQVRQAARRRGCVVLLAGDPALAKRWGADGHHGRARIGAMAGGRWLHSAPVHDHCELVAAVGSGANALLISPLFATRSHPGAGALGPARFAALARHSPLPVIALGGVHPRHTRIVRMLGAAGFAAIDGLARPRRLTSAARD